ncbi:MAG: NAD(P)-binding domain-containing protein [candidate division SR1 bacterium]|nr:NAD(P)-binding domain-containing protein [candidate division SR1 bacterium]
MKIGILGSGEVGKALAIGFASSGHQVKIGSRDFENSKLKIWANELEDLILVDSFEKTATFGDIIVLAIKWDGVENAIHLANPENLSHKTVIDVTNPLNFSNGMPPSLYIGHTNSGGEIIQRLLPKSCIVKTLNIVNNHTMINPTYNEGIPSMFLCGNSENAKKQVTQILKDFGWKDITDLGDITECRIIEPITCLWIKYGMKHNTWTHAIRFLKH